jgi:predicted hydrocarbon binding protein
MPCEFFLGLLKGAFEIAGLSAEVKEIKCQWQANEPKCVYEIKWEAEEPKLNI